MRYPHPDPALAAAVGVLLKTTLGKAEGRENT